MGVVGFRAEAAAAVGLVVGIVALEPLHMAVALEGEDVGGDPVQEPAVVADDQHGAGKGEQRLLQRAQGLDIEVVGRLVQQQQVGAGLEHLGEMDSVALAAGEATHLLLLVRALEVEGGDIGAARDLARSERDHVEPARNLLPDRLVGGQRLAALVHRADLHRLADAQNAAVRRLLAGQHPEERGLAGAVRPDHADYARRRQAEGDTLHQQPVAERLGHAFRLDHHVAQPRPRRDDDLGRVERPALALGQQLLIGPEPRPALGLPGARALADPFELALQHLAPRALLLLLQREAALLLLQPGGVIALERDAAPAVQLQDPAGDIVEEVAVMGDGHHRALIPLQEALQPGDALGVQMVGRLVQQQQVRPGEQQAAERHPPPLATGKRRRVRVARRAAQRVHRDLDRALQFPAVGRVDPLLQFALLLYQRVHLLGRQVLREARAHLVEAFQQPGRLRHALHDIAHHVAAGVEFRLLRQVADARAVGGPRLAVEFGLDAGHDAHERRFAGAVRPEHADLGAGQEGEADIVEHLPPARIGLGEPVHHIDILV